MLGEVIGEQIELTGRAAAWADLWFWVMLVGGMAFLGILVYSVLTGAADIKDLFQSLKADHDAEQAKAAGGQGPSLKSETEAELEARK